MCTKGAMFKCLLMCYVALFANGDVAMLTKDAVLQCLLKVLTVNGAMLLLVNGAIAIAMIAKCN